MNTAATSSKKQLKPAPDAPLGVKYALTVPQSVLFADLSLQGNLREYFVEAMGLDYEPAYIAIDAGGAMSWNYDNDTVFNTAFTSDRSIADAVTAFIATMGTTARKLDRRSTLGVAALRRQGNADDVLADLQEFWHAYKLHMTSLFTFWNAEALLGKAIADEVQAAGLDADQAELDKFIKSRETNQFVRERRLFERLVQRFAGSEPVTKENATPELIAALQHHAREFSFLLTPFNLGNKPTADALLERVAEVQSSPTTEAEPKLPDLPTTPQLKKLIDLLQQLTFWKNERLDVLSMADARMELLYQAAAEVLDIPLNTLFAMTCSEIEQSLAKGAVAVDQGVLSNRLQTYCLILSEGTIDFYQPSGQPAKQSAIPQAEIGAELQGVVASKGIASGTVRVIESDADLAALQSGDILVTTMTRPEYGAALDRAAAFVTDEGGMLCHAAIISREMGKPCITNTEFGTKVLRTGMAVTVDADRGVVTIDKL